MLSEFDRIHVLYVMREGDWFSAHLLRLINKADHANREKIREIYPEHVAAWEAWRDGEDQEEWPPN